MTVYFNSYPSAATAVVVAVCCCCRCCCCFFVVSVKFCFCFCHRSDFCASRLSKCFLFFCYCWPIYCISRLYSADLFPLSKCLSILYRIAPVLQTVLILLSFNRLQVAIAFWRAMGGSEEEIAGLGGDGDS